MIKFIIILLIALVFESTGIVFLKKGMNQIGELKIVSVPEVARVIKAGVTNPQILLGVFFEAIFFGFLLYLMSKSDISFLWPLTALTFVFATLAAMLFLDEKVSGVRWAGVALIMAGAALICYSQRPKPKAPEPAPMSQAPTAAK